MSYAVKKNRIFDKGFEDAIMNTITYVGTEISKIDDIFMDGLNRMVQFANNSFQLSALPTDLTQVPHLLASEVFPSLKLVHIPESLDYRGSFGYIEPQGDAPICVGASGAAMMQWKERNNKTQYKLTNGQVILSPHFIEERRMNPHSAGMTGHDLMRILTNFGVCSKQMYLEYQSDCTNKNLQLAMEKEALNARISEYALLDTIDSTKIALFVHGPCIFICPCYNETTRMWVPSKTDDLLKGGHSMLIVGYTSEGFILQNWWGPGWGNNGCCIFPFSDWGKHWEAWTCVDDNSALISPEYVSSGCACSIM